jgi:hypothetical protein
VSFDNLRQIVDRAFGQTIVTQRPTEHANVPGCSPVRKHHRTGRSIMAANDAIALLKADHKEERMAARKKQLMSKMEAAA